MSTIPLSNLKIDKFYNLQGIEDILSLPNRILAATLCNFLNFLKTQHQRGRQNDKT